METEPTSDQLALLRQLLRENSPGYVDFAVWGPFGGRVKKALAHKGFVMGPDSKHTMEEFRGPPSIDHWLACWRVYMTGMIMLDAADHPSMEAYAKHITKLAKQWGVSCWATLYQAEVRFRREMMERVRQDETDNLQLALNANGSYPFDPVRPWDRCYEVAVTGQRWLQYWSDEVTVPSITIAIGTTSSSHFLGGDAEIASSSNAHLATAYAVEPPPPAHGKGGKRGARDDDRRPPAKGEPDRKRIKKETNNRQHHVNASGAYSHNRRGHPICAGYQDGSCTGPLCGKGGSHQCDKCLDPRHGSAHPYPCRAAPVAPAARDGKAGGKGKSKKGRGSKW
jgi:hypothetical protein